MPSYSYSKSLEKNKNTINKKILYNYGVEFKDHMKLQKFVRDNVKQFEFLNSNFKVIDLNKFFCDTKKCKIGNKKGSFYSDKNHLSLYGAELLKNEIKTYLD
jgi:hypothetical protein